MTLRISPRAEIQAASVALDLARISPELGVRFLDGFEAAVREIGEEPHRHRLLEGFSRADHKIRAIRVSLLNWCLVVFLVAEPIIIVAVVDTRSDFGEMLRRELNEYLP